METELNCVAEEYGPATAYSGLVDLRKKVVAERQRHRQKLVQLLHRHWTISWVIYLINLVEIFESDRVICWCDETESWLSAQINQLFENPYYVQKELDRRADELLKDIRWLENDHNGQGRRRVKERHYRWADLLEMAYAELTSASALLHPPSWT